MVCFLNIQNYLTEKTSTDIFMVIKFIYGKSRQLYFKRVGNSLRSFALNKTINIDSVCMRIISNIFVF